MATPISSLPARALAVALALATLALSTASAQEDPVIRKAIVFVIDQVTWQDIAAVPTPHIDSLIEQGGSASMNCAAAPPTTRAKAHLSLGAGSRAQASEGKPDHSYDVPPGAGPQPEIPLPDYALPGQIVNPWSDALRRDNERLLYDVSVGALGDALHEAGLKTAVVGNADYGVLPLRPARAAVTIAMDSRGIVDLGDVGLGLLQAVADDSLRSQTNVPALVQKVRDCLPRADLIVIEPGDTVRAAFSASDPLRPDRYERDRKRRALQRADYCLGEVLPELHSQWLLIVISPSPSPTQFEWMTPIVVSGAAKWPSGLLTSGTTHRPGLVAAMDVAPTILEYFHIPIPEAMLGRGLRTHQSGAIPPSGSARAERFADAERRIHNTYRARRILVPAHVAAVWLAALLALLYASRGGPSTRPRLRRPVAALQLLMLAAPIACFLVHLAPPDLSPIQIIAAMAGGGIVLAVTVTFLPWEHLAPIRQICWLQVIIIVVDIWAFDARLQLGSLYGYSPIAGARFYGLGNEALSLLMGAAIIAFSTTPSFWQQLRWPRILLPALGCLLLTVTIGHPRLGANTGGTITAVVTCGTWLLLQAQPRRRGLAIALLAGAVVAVLGAFILVDVLAPGGGTHMGHAAREVLSGGPAAALGIVARKLHSSAAVLAVSPWTAVLVAWVAFILYAAIWPPQVLRRTWDDHPPLRAAARALAIGAIVGSLVNDIGICVAALMAGYALFAMTFAAVIERPARS